MPARASERLPRLVWWAGCLGLAAAGANYALIKSMHHDVAYYVNAVERMLDGARLYRDLIDVNVPTIYGVMAPPIWLARRFGIDPMLAYNLFVLLLATLSTWAAYRAARRVLPNAGFSPGVLAGVLLVGFLVVPGFDFGQREHLAAMLLAPYAVVRAGVRPARSGIGFRAAVGIAAGIGVALKPHFALIWLGMEGALLMRHGWRGWRPGLEGILLALAAGLCAAATLAFFPEYHQRILPLARAVYDGFERPLAEILAGLGPRLVEYAVMAMVAAPLAMGSNRRHGDLVIVLMGGAVGGYAAFLLQSKGWNYQALPALIFSIAAFALALAARVQGDAAVVRPHRLMAAIAGALAGIALIVFAVDLIRAYRADAAQRSFFAATIAALRDYAQGGPALFISLEVAYTFPGVNYAGAAYPYRWHHLLPMPGLYRDFAPGPEGRLVRTPGEMGDIERDFFESFTDDALQFPPRIVLVDRRRSVRPGLSPELDLLAYFCQSPRFAELMTGYDWLGRRAFYDVLVPRAAPTAGPGPCGAPRSTNPTANGDAEKDNPRRLAQVVQLQCATLDVKGKHDYPTQANQLEIFITEHMKTPPNADLYGEVVRSLSPTNNQEFHANVKLIR